MGRKYIFHDSKNLYFVSFATVSWIDVLVRRIYFEIVTQSIQYCIGHKGFELFAWCIMPSHVHLIISSEKSHLSDIMRDLKRHTSKQLISSIQLNIEESRKEWMLWMLERAGKKNPNNLNYQFWQQNNHPIELSTNEMVEQRLQYLHMNPVEAGFVSEPHHYLYSSAIDYSGGKRLLPVLSASSKLA